MCNGCNDDRDGAVDEGTNITCDDNVNCTVDFCLFGECQNLERPQVCRRGNCTRGVCLGAAGPGPTEIDPRVRPPLDGNGCTWDESDTRCESFDNCNCNGMAICQGAIGPTWSGVYPLSGAERSLLTTSQASCRPRQPLEPRYPPNDTRFILSLCNGPCPTGEQCVVGVCYPVRNGGCETNANVCSIDDVCVEPSPSTSTCQLFAGGPGSPGAALRAQQQSLLDLVNERAASIDGLPVACVADVLGQDVPPAPFDELCRDDGLPCTAPFAGTNGCIITPPTSLGATPGVACALEPPRDAGDTVEISPEFVGVDGSGNSVRGPSCAGDPVLSATGAPSCYRAECNGMGACGGVAANDACDDVLDAGWCGAPFVCDGLPGYPSGAGVELDRSLWGPTDVPVIGCRRSGCLIEAFPNAGCWAAGTGPAGTCATCSPAFSDSEFTTRTTGNCGGLGMDGQPCGRCNGDGLCINTNTTCPI